MKIFIITLTKIELYDEPKKGKFTDTGILEVEPSSLALKLLSPAAEPNGQNWLSGKQNINPWLYRITNIAIWKQNISAEIWKFGNLPWKLAYIQINYR